MRVSQEEARYNGTKQCLNEYSFRVIISEHKLAGSQEPGGRNAAHSSLNTSAHCPDTESSRWLISQLNAI